MTAEKPVECSSSDHDGGPEDGDHDGGPEPVDKPVVCDDCGSDLPHEFTAHRWEGRWELASVYRRDDGAYCVRQDRARPVPRPQHDPGCILPRDHKGDHCAVHARFGQILAADWKDALIAALASKGAP